MKCPVDGATLVMSERQRIEIDYCPECRGVWLDRGELDKIIERAEQERDPAPAPPPAPAAPAAPVAPPPQHQPPPPGYGSERQRDWRYDSDRHEAIGWSGHRKKRKSFLSELFDD
jgi:Zn-finger nucleic acid-binding protein